MKIIKEECDYKVSSWSGGITKELYIYPQSSSYVARDFSIRISSATIELEESIFTSLPDYNRVLMILDGSLELNHQDHYTKILEKYHCDYFDGAWTSSSKGKVVDFNLMTSKNLQGQLKYQKVIKTSKYVLDNMENTIIKAVYLISGKMTLTTTDELINPGSLLILQDERNNTNLEALEDTEFILIEVWFFPKLT